MGKKDCGSNVVPQAGILRTRIYTFILSFCYILQYNEYQTVIRNRFQQKCMCSWAMRKKKELSVCARGYRHYITDGCSNGDT